MANKELPMRVHLHHNEKQPLVNKTEAFWREPLEASSLDLDTGHIPVALFPLSQSEAALTGLHVLGVTPEGEDAVALGLSTGQALGKLRDQLTALLEQHQRATRRQSSALEQWTNSFLFHGNRHSCLHWPGVALTLLVILGFLCCYGSQPKGSSGVELSNAAALLLLLLVNLLLVRRQLRLQKTEMVRRLRAIIGELNEYLSACVDDVRWATSMYPDLYTPTSPSWSLHWTYRDSQLVNCPVSLLVEGDIIALRPGQEAFASLRGIKDDEHIVLEPGDLFPPFSPPPSPQATDKRGPQSPQHHRLFRVVRTPVLDTVRNGLELAQSRPVTVLDNERFTVQSVITKLVCPVVLTAFLIVNTIRYFCDAPSLTPLCYNFFQLQLMGVLPILPLLFPVMWVLVNAFGEARVLAEFSKASPAGLLAKFSEDTLSSYTEVISSQEMLRCVWRHFVGVLKGESQTLCYTSSLLHTLGSVTVLCCVDKQGILSWPNPSPETVLFFSGRVEPPHNSQDDLGDDLSVNSFCRMDTEEDQDEAQEGEALLCQPSGSQMECIEPGEMSQDTALSTENLRPRKSAQSTRTRTKHHSGSNVSFSHDTEGGEEDQAQEFVLGCPEAEADDFVCDYHLEMLSLSQDQQNPASIQFDDLSWQCHLPSLKPLGLNIMLNLCNASVTQQLCKFSDHLSNLALQESHGIVQPVNVPGAFVSFTPGARELFKQENHLALYQLPSGEKTKELASRRLHYFIKRQPPLSHLISLFVRDSSSNHVQMLSHGSADLILEACTDFWDGTDIYPLSGSDRTCVFSGLELPSTTPLKQGSCRNSWSSDEGIGEGAERDDCVNALSGQIFIGMVSSQFQARLDTVRLIDALVTACIRFVYFSMEDELRSKVTRLCREDGFGDRLELSHLLTPNGDSPCDGAPPAPATAHFMKTSTKVQPDIGMI
ncbi:hypothetical protein WMY93_010817 [Mugilogobius chulae]|uniref:Transmembrane protein 94 n=1 Tax=Mugilogobius chulae TaxID=88201 RepID=A0AAW0PLB7_9GOBI